MIHREASEEGWIGVKAEFNFEVSMGGEVLKPFVVQRFQILKKKESNRVKSGGQEHTFFGEGLHFFISTEIKA